MVRFLYAHDHEQMLDLINPPARASSLQLRRIEDYIVENWLRPLNVETLANVSSVALSCGFQSLGHFASDYRDFFGELPSATLASS